MAPFTFSDTAEEASIEYKKAPFLSPLGIIQMTGALFFSSYFFFWIIGLALLIGSVQLALMSATAASALAVTYVASFFVYKPHLSRGWAFHWFLYGILPDWVLGYHEATCIREGPALDPDQPYLFTMAPHGVFGVCRAFSGGTLWCRLFPGISARWGSFGGAFYIPGVREFSLCCGCLDASRSVLTRAVKRGENLILLPGGEKEMMLTDGESTETKLVINDRKGFVRLAVQHGMHLVPGFCFGEKWIHETVLLPKPVRKALYQKFRLAGVVLKGRWWTFLGRVEKPDGSPIRLGFVWGKPIVVRQDPECSAAYVNEVASHL